MRPGCGAAMLELETACAATLHRPIYRVKGATAQRACRGARRYRALQPCQFGALPPRQRGVSIRPAGTTRRERECFWGDHLRAPVRVEGATMAISGPRTAGEVDGILDLHAALS